MSAPGGGIAADAGLLALAGSVFRRVWRDASWSLLGNLLTLISGLAVLKLIGLLVESAEYGTASLVLGVAGLLTQLISNPLITERARIYFDHIRSGNKVVLFRAVQRYLLVSSAIGATLYLGFSVALSLQDNRTYLQLILPVFWLLFASPQYSAVLVQLEAHREYRSLAFAQPVMLVLQLPVLALLLWTSLRGSYAIVLAQAVAVFAVYAWLRLRLARASSLHPQGPDAPLPPVTAMGGALYLSNIASWVMTNGDRFLVDYYLARTDVGIYVINYAFFSIPYTIVNGWISSVTRPRLYLRAAEQQWERVLRVCLGALASGLGLGVLGTGVIYFLGRSLALQVIGERYWHSEQLMMVIAIAHVFFITGHTATLYYLAVKDSRIVWISCALMAVTNVSLNMLLLPRMGLMAAAWATFITYLAWSAVLVAGILILSRSHRLAGTAA